MTSVDTAASVVAAAASSASAATGSLELGTWTGGQELAVIALAGTIVILGMAAVILLRTPDSVDLETRKIYYANDAASKNRAESIHDLVIESGFHGPIQKYASDDAFFERVNPPGALEVRYEAGIEDEAANALISIVDSPIGTREQGVDGSDFKLPVARQTSSRSLYQEVANAARSSRSVTRSRYAGRSLALCRADASSTRRLPATAAHVDRQTP